MVMDSRTFRWVVASIATVAVIGLGWMVNDMRKEMKRTNELVHESLPPILENAKKSTDTLALVSKDVESLRDLAGLTDTAQDPALSRCQVLAPLPVLLEGLVGILGVPRELAFHVLGLRGVVAGFGLQARIEVGDRRPLELL